ncbi:parallel beta-helix repeat (two copies) [Gemmobacter megaterium]|uniref:Parallel beta-helix repeat (Two copies) n=2 Tax=Gemmobacter megaterium TaxID=1086013 RepID=A0A1N7K5W9_9RHOB|nr:hypothetical protein GCM10011345_02320 [Gemmobacter megaterium]SIS57015.1 parallel beta-helix repeat (two copies) [Gemmobacter megaterium]
MQAQRGPVASFSRPARAITQPYCLPRLGADTHATMDTHMLRRAALALTTLSVLAGPAQTSPGTIPTMPGPVELDQLRARLHDTAPPAPAPGKVALRPVAGMPTLGGMYRRLPQPPARWRGQAIVLEGGSFDLASVAAALPDPGWLDCDGSRCILSAPLVVGRGTTLVIDGIDLRLGQDEGAALLSWGQLIISDATLRAWHLSSDTPAATDDKGAAFRPHLAAFAASHTLIRRSDLHHLGHQGAMSYGLSFGTEGRSGIVTEHPSVDMIGNRLLDVYFGFFSFDADGVNILDNHIAESHVYGIDPHDDTRNMLIHGNYVLGARHSHGIILSRRIHNTVVSYNVSAGNKKAGIFLDKACHDVLIIGNDSFLNGTEGLTLHEVARVAVIGNRFHNNAADGIRLRASEQVFLDGNTVTANGKHGLRAYDWQGSKRAPNTEEQGQILPMRVGLVGNRVHSNKRGDCRLSGEARITSGQPFLCPVPPPPQAQAVPARFGPGAGNAP